MLAPLVLCLFALPLSGCSRHPLSEHFEALRSLEAHAPRAATPLPWVSSGPVLKLQADLFLSKAGGNLAESFSALMALETSLRQQEPAKAFPWVFCGLQRAAREARAALAAVASSPSSSPSPSPSVLSRSAPPLAFVSKVDEVACWRLRVSAAVAQELAGAPAFFHASPWPAASKFGPGVVYLARANRGPGEARAQGRREPGEPPVRLVPAREAFSRRPGDGILVRLDKVWRSFFGLSERISQQAVKPLRGNTRRGWFISTLAIT